MSKQLLDRSRVFADTVPSLVSSPMLNGSSLVAEANPEGNNAMPISSGSANTCTPQNLFALLNVISHG